MVHPKEAGWCKYCNHYKYYGFENECMAIGGENYSSYRVENCEHFEWLDHIRESMKMVESEVE